MYKFCSVIITHFHKNDERSEFMQNSLASLTENTEYPVEITVIDNGDSEGDTDFLLQLTKMGKINTYIRNARNMHFGYARNQGFAMSDGDYICIADNDIFYKSGWLKDCIDVLEEYPDKKIYATPIYNVAHWADKFWSDEVLTVGDKKYRLNLRAGSNCFVMRRKDYLDVGLFEAHRVAGTKWTELAISKGYLAAVTPELMIEDMGFRKGYSFRDPIPVKKCLSNGDEMYFNEDEFRNDNKGKFNFRKQQLRCCI